MSSILLLLLASVSGGVALKFVDWSIWKGTHRSLRFSIRLFEHLNLFNESWKDPSQKNQMPTLIGSFSVFKELCRLYRRQNEYSTQTNIFVKYFFDEILTSANVRS